MKKNISRQKLTLFVFRRAGGFTLIELMVAVTVLMVLVGVGAMSLNNFNGTKELDSVREEVANYIKLARNLAITRQLPSGASNLKYVRVNFVGNTLTTLGVDSDNIENTSPPYSSTTINTKNEIVISMPSFGFMAGTGRLTDVNGNLIGTTMTIDVSRGTDKKTININDLGVVNNVN